MAELLRKLLVEHRRSSPYYLQANGLVEKTNNTLINIISKVVLERRREWDWHMFEAFWVYRTTHKTVTGFTPFQLTFGIEATISIELELASLQMAVRYFLGDTESLAAQVHTLEGLDESRQQALQNYETVQRKRKLRHDSQKKVIQFGPGELVMMVDHWLAKQHGQKFKPKWIGPYVIHQSFDNGSYRMSTPEGIIMKKLYNGAKLKRYYHHSKQVPSAAGALEPGEGIIMLKLTEGYGSQR